MALINGMLKHSVWDLRTNPSLIKAWMCKGWLWITDNQKPQYAMRPIQKIQNEIEILNEKITIQFCPFQMSSLVYDVTRIQNSMKGIMPHDWESSEHINELTNRIDQMKRIICNNHPQVMQYGFEAVFQIYFPTDEKLKSSNPINVTASFGWQVSTEKCNLLHSELVKAGKLNCTQNEWQSHFIGTSGKLEKIVWCASVYESVKLFSWLSEKDKIAYRYDYLVLLCQHFVDRRGRHLNIDCLRSYKSLPYKSQRVENIYNRIFYLLELP
ncbi:MAG: hypothetical protein IPO63_10225 [Bacteroidetes bacterium]|nr:hypothetical protein [Bacteroidota bacterium]